MEPSSPTKPVEHLCVLVHGLWGNPAHLDYLRHTLKSRYGPDSGLYVLVAKSNSDSFTYDGIAVGGERITDEIERTIKEIEEKQHTEIKRISITGYSLGGLVSRYAIGLLYKNGIFDRIEPVNFTTFATPHLGVRTPLLGVRAYAWNILGSRTLSVSGQQMFLVDNFRSSGRPLLSILADPNNIFMKGLRLFKHKSIYANTLNDRSVPYYTASFSRTDPFVDLDKIDVHYLEDQEDPVILDPANPVTLREPPTEVATFYQRYMPTHQTMTILPFYIVIFSLMPIALPTFLVNSVYQTYRSAQRVKLHEAGKAGISLTKYQFSLLKEAQAAQERIFEQFAEDQKEDILPEPSDDAKLTPQLDQINEMSKRESSKEDSPFPVLALTAEQFEMIDNLDALGFTKYRAHIQNHRHTHAAIVVRIQKDSFAEGRTVVKHWAKQFEV